MFYLKKNFQQIKFILDNYSSLEVKALNFLTACKNKKDISYDILNTIVNIAAKTTDNHTNILCYSLILDVTSTGRKVSQNIISHIVNEKDQSLAQKLIAIIANNQELSAQTDIIFMMNNIEPSVHNDILRNLLNKIEKELQSSFKLSSFHADKLLSIYEMRQKLNDYSNNKEFVNVFSLILLKKSKLFRNRILSD